MSRVAWDDLLAATQAAHVSHATLSAFCPFADDITAGNVVPYDIPAASLMAGDTNLVTEIYPDLRDAFITAGRFARWRETYKGTKVSDDFINRFACYCLIGEGGAFRSGQMWNWVVYMPRQLYYPWHQHPAEEAYLVIAGEAEFLAEGRPNQTLRPGETSIHASNQPHAMQTHEHPVMALVSWRNGFDTPPVLTHEDAR